eukprot:Clim_evm5s109 gene=Clim_evmTU5s109
MYKVVRERAVDPETGDKIVFDVISISPTSPEAKFDSTELSQGLQPQAKELSLLDTKLRSKGGNLCATNGPLTAYAIAAKSGAGLVRVTAPHTGERVTLRGHQAAICDLAFSPIDRNILASMDTAGDIRLHLLSVSESGEIHARCVISMLLHLGDEREKSTANISQPITGRILKWHNVDKNILAVGWGKDVLILNILQLSSKAERDDNNEPTVRVDNNKLSSGLLVFANHRGNGRIACLDFTADGMCIGSASDVGETRLWDLTTAQEYAVQGSLTGDWIHFAYSMEMRRKGRSNFEQKIKMSPAEAFSCVITGSSALSATGPSTNIAVSHHISGQLKTVQSLTLKDVVGHMRFDDGASTLFFMGQTQRCMLAAYMRSGRTFAYLTKINTSSEVLSCSSTVDGETPPEDSLGLVSLSMSALMAKSVAQFQLRLPFGEPQGGIQGSGTPPSSARASVPETSVPAPTSSEANAVPSSKPIAADSADIAGSDQAAVLAEIRALRQDMKTMVQDTVRQELPQILQRTFVEQFQRALLPAYERISKEMFEQMARHFNGGLAEYKHALSTSATSVSQNPIPNAEELGSTLGVAIASELVPRLQAALNHQLGLRTNARQSVGDLAAEKQLTWEEIEELFNKGEVAEAFERTLRSTDKELLAKPTEAFERTLRSTDKELLAKLCRRADATTTMDALQQHQILALIALLVQVPEENEMRAEWLNEAIMAINEDSDTVKEKGGPLLGHVSEVLRQQADVLLTEDPRNKPAKRLHMLSFVLETMARRLNA